MSVIICASVNTPKYVWNLIRKWLSICFPCIATCTCDNRNKLSSMMYPLMTSCYCFMMVNPANLYAFHFWFFLTVLHGKWQVLTNHVFQVLSNKPSPVLCNLPSHSVTHNWSASAVKLFLFCCQVSPLVVACCTNEPPSSVDRYNVTLRHVRFGPSVH